MQELLLLTLMSTLSPMPMQCADQEQAGGIAVSNDFDFSSNNKEETGSGSIFGPSTFEATEGVKPATAPAA